MTSAPTLDRLRLRNAPLISVVMPNYNYGHFIGAAVDSALRLDWPRVEVIVVDDGSTDDSLEVLAGFGRRITVMRQDNAGPRTACNRGFAASRGELVIFLDSDDQLEPSLAREVMAVWHEGVSKVQVQMQRVDPDNRAFGDPFPTLTSAMRPQDLRHWVLATGAYPTPPGSGNVYTRDFLTRLFPLDDSCGDATDSACLAAAPILGDVLTVASPLVRYRVHPDNRSKLSDAGRFTRQIERAFQRQTFALRVAGRPDDATSVMRSLRRGRHLVQLRVAEQRLNPGRPPLPQDSRSRQLVDAVRSMAAPGPERLRARVLVAGWCVLTALAPATVARRLISRRFG